MHSAKINLIKSNNEIMMEIAMFTSDKPIDCPENDILNRNKFAESLAKTIIEWDQSDSIVFAINAKWGYGKTSLLNLVKLQIESKTHQPATRTSKILRILFHRKIEIKGKRIYTVDYNPWGFDDQDRIHNVLFQDISRAIKWRGFDLYFLATSINIYNSALKKRLTVPIEWLLSFLITGLGSYTFLGVSKLLFGILFSLFIVMLIISIASVYVYATVSPVTIKKKLSSYIQSRSLRLIVFIDDIDRLSRDEILSLLKIIRVNADFPNCVYVLALDYEVVSNMVGSQEFGINGYDYLNKIIQINLTLPAHDPELIRSYIVNDLASYCDSLKMLAITKQFEEGAKHWYYIQEAGLWSMICSLREAKRFLNVVKYLLTLLSNNGTMEVNTLDLLSIEAIRLYDPSSYEFVKSNEDLFCNNRRGFLENKEDAAKRHTEFYKQWVSTIIEDKKALVLGLLRVLFPQLKNYEPNVFGYIDSDERDEIKTLRINTKEHFAKYFSFNFEKTGDCVAQLDVEILTNSRDYDKLQDIVKRHIETNSLTHLLTRLTNDISEEAIKSKSFETLLQVLFNVSDSVSYDYQGMFTNQEYDTLYYSSLNIIKRIGASEADRVVPILIEQSEGLYAPVQLMYSILHSDKSTPYYQPIVSDGIVETIQNRTIRLIERRKEDLLDHPQFSFIFDCWYEWSDDKSSVTIYRNGLYQDDTKLLLVLDKIQNKVHSSNRVEPIRYFDLFAKSSTHDIELMHSRVLDIVNQHEEIYGANKKMVDRFLSDYEDFKQGKKVDWSNIDE